MARRLRLPKKRTIEVNASIFRRILAFAIDLLIINLVIATPLRRVLVDMIPLNGSFFEIYNFLLNNSELNKTIMWISLALSTLTILYFAILEWKLGQTIGKVLLKVHVKSDSKEFKLWQAIIRNLFLLPFFPFVLLWVIDPLFMLFTKNSQRLTEIFSKSKVVQYHEV
jgi:hypothetical protein